AKFYIVAHQPPTFVGQWDSTQVAAGVSYDVSKHVTLSVIEGADTNLGALAIDSVTFGAYVRNQGGCLVNGTVITCVSGTDVSVNVWPHASTASGQTYVNEPGDLV